MISVSYELSYIKSYINLVVNQSCSLILSTAHYGLIPLEILKGEQPHFKQYGFYCLMKYTVSSHCQVLTCAVHVQVMMLTWCGNRSKALVCLC